MVWKRKRHGEPPRLTWWLDEGGRLRTSGSSAAARLCGCSVTHLRRVLAGECPPGPDLRRRLAKLGIDLDGGRTA